jgi:hypothetical protein
VIIADFSVRYVVMNTRISLNLAAVEVGQAVGRIPSIELSAMNEHAGLRISMY